MATTTQMNVRLDAALKAKGDAVLAQAGYTPSAAVRALWSFAASHAEDPQSVSSLLNSASTQADENFQAQKNEAINHIHQGRALVNNARTQLGFSEPSEPPALKDNDDSSPTPKDNDDSSYDDLLYDAMLSRMKERGLA